MALPIWIPDALRSEQSPVKKTFWRCVEAQHVVSTLQLVDTLDEQRLLEDILEDLDLVCVMSVNPGFGGQKFKPEMMPKVR